MKRLNKFVTGLGLVAVLAAGSSNIFAKTTDGARRRVIGGQIVSIDRTTRTIVVRDASTNQTFAVQVPDGTVVRTMSMSGAPLNFEQLLAGMVVRDLTVK
jgi:hypothetical protein